MCSYCKKHDETEVPDPYYGGPQGFEKVILVYFDSENMKSENTQTVSLCSFLSILRSRRTYISP